MFILQHLSFIYIAALLVFLLATSLHDREFAIPSRYDEAIKIISVLAFANKCPGIEPNIQRICLYFQSLGMDLDCLRQDAAARDRISSEVVRLREAKKDNFRTALERFGPNGVELRDALRRA